MHPMPGATDPPPPQPEPTTLRNRPLRLAGIVIACSTPITGFISYAFGSILFGESRLEGPDGLTLAGFAALGLPLVVGVLMVLWSVLTSQTPSRRSVAAAAAAVCAGLLGAGLWSTLSSNGDASIGGGLLVLASLPFAVAAVVMLRTKPST